MRAHVLIVDDTAAVLSLAARVLVDAGFTVTTAASAADALAALESRPVDVVVTDVVMPAMDGFTLGAQIAVRLPDTRVVYMSGRLAANGSTPGNVLEKPFTAAALVHAVESVLAPS